MTADFSLPSVVLFFEGTGRLEVFQKLVSGLQRGGRRVHVFVGARVRPANLAAPEPAAPRSSVQPAAEACKNLA